MTTTLNEAPAAAPQGQDRASLRAGERLDRATFHVRYQAMPEGTRAELVEGIVTMPSPADSRHGRPHLQIGGWAFGYEAATPGVIGLDNTSVFLSDDTEVQPDVALIVDPALGGATGEEGGYVTGPPELVVEVAASSESYDLGAKKRAYEGAGVREYLVVLVESARVAWFVWREQGFEELARGEDGILRSETFPGLWLDPAALLRQDAAGVRDAAERGLASPEHGTFVAEMQARRQRSV